MYNRYIPTNDGSYHRRSVHEPSQQTEPNHPHPEPPPSPEPQNQCREVNHVGPSGFLKNLLPKNFDIGDLIVVLLVLLMAGECEEEQNTALLTLALYFFL